ncbi:MAG: inosose dehydratase [Blastocatellia bacterium]
MNGVKVKQIVSRRNFLQGIGALATASLVPAKALTFAAPLFDLPASALFDKAAATANIRFAYAAITWKGNDVQAIQDISEVGYRGIQLRFNAVRDYGARPQALRDLLDQHHLELVALSSGDVSGATDRRADEIARHTRNAEFVRDIGGHYLQLIDSAMPKGRKPLAEDYRQLGQVMTEIGKRTADLGIGVGYHNHMGGLGEAPDDVERILNEADPRYVKLLLDIAHYAQGGGDPARAIRQYRDRLLFFHIKDVEAVTPKTAGDAAQAYRFVELGRGRVNLPGVFAAIKEIKFRGWAVVELDDVPDPLRTPKASAIISKRYLEEKLKMKV